MLTSFLYSNCLALFSAPFPDTTVIDGATEFIGIQSTEIFPVYEMTTVPRAVVVVTVDRTLFPLALSTARAVDLIYKYDKVIEKKQFSLDLTYRSQHSREFDKPSAGDSEALSASPDLWAPQL